AKIIKNTAPYNTPTTHQQHKPQTTNTYPNDRLNTTPINAPNTIKPSNPILTTPERSLNTPPNAVKINGEAKNKAGGIMDCNKSIIYLSSFLKRRITHRII